jgi:type IV fimbrial biogenesis protein FimT
MHCGWHGFDHILIKPRRVNGCTFQNVPVSGVVALMVSAKCLIAEGRPASVRGFSLVELLVVLVIVATLTAMAGPSLTGLVSALRLRLATDALVRSLTLTRSEAIKRNTRVVMCKSRSGVACEPAGEWGLGWVIFQDLNNNTLADPGEMIVFRQEAFANTLVFGTNTPLRNYVSYSPLGNTRYPYGALQMGTFTVCLRSPRPTVALDVVLGNVGNPRVAKRTLFNCPENASRPVTVTDSPRPPES